MSESFKAKVLDEKEKMELVRDTDALFKRSGFKTIVPLTLIMMFAQLAIIITSNEKVFFVFDFLLIINSLMIIPAFLLVQLFMIGVVNDLADGKRINFLRIFGDYLKFLKINARGVVSILKGRFVVFAILISVALIVKFSFVLLIISLSEMSVGTNDVKSVVENNRWDMAAQILFLFTLAAIQSPLFAMNVILKRLEGLDVGFVFLAKECRKNEGICWFAVQNSSFAKVVLAFFVFGFVLDGLIASILFYFAFSYLICFQVMAYRSIYGKGGLKKEEEEKVEVSEKDLVSVPL